MERRYVARLALALVVVMLGVIAPAFVASAAQTHEAVAVADAWVNSYRPGKNHGTDRRLKTYAGGYEAYLRFDLTPWSGKKIKGLELVLDGVTGDATVLTADETLPSWNETTVNYRNRPSATSIAEGSTPVSVGALASGPSASFDVAAFFESGAVDRDVVSFRISSSAPAVVGFGSRESATPPRLLLSTSNPVKAPPLAVMVDTYASEVTPTTNYAPAQSLVVDANPHTDTYIRFDMSSWYGQSVNTLKLGLWFKDEAGAGVSIYRIAGTWIDTDVTWDTRPEDGELLGSLATRTPAGATLIDLGPVFASGFVDKPTLSLRLTTSNTNGFVLSSSEGAFPPFLVVSSDSVPATPSPSASLTPSPSASTTPSPSASLTPSPSASPSPSPSPSSSPSASPSPTATPTATPSPSPTERWYFVGYGSDHGVGMSQYGARGRANAGQTYDEILAHYYSGTTLGTIDPDQVIRVLLATAHVPTSSSPARITARGGMWSSDAFEVDGEPVVFAPNSYAQMERDGADWVVNAYDSTGTLIASAETSDLTMRGRDSSTLFEMRFRDSLPKYDLYRGAMRLLGNGSAVTAINSVDMDDYLKGVVPAEMPPLWHIEAVKAQAVAARGYAIVRLKPANVYDVRPTSDNQVYGGVRLEHPRSNLAVDATADRVVMAGDVPANTYFFTVAGGYTENNELAWVNNVGKVVGDPVSYLRGVPDVDEDGQAYDRSAPGYTWQTDSFTWRELQHMLAADTRTNVGTLRDIRFERGVSGRIYRVTVVGTRKTAVISGQALKGIYNSHRLAGGSLRSSLFYLEPAP